MHIGKNHSFSGVQSSISGSKIGQAILSKKFKLPSKKKVKKEILNPNVEKKSVAKSEVKGSGNVIYKFRTAVSKFLSNLGKGMKYSEVTIKNEEKWKQMAIEEQVIMTEQEVGPKTLDEKLDAHLTKMEEAAADKADTPEEKKQMSTRLNDEMNKFGEELDKVTMNDDKKLKFNEVVIKMCDILEKANISEKDKLPLEDKWMELGKKLGISLCPIILNPYGIKREKFEAVENYYKDNKAELETLKEPTFIPRDETGLSRSLAYVPEGPRKGMYMLLKEHGDAKQLGVGSFNRATIAINLDTGEEEKVFRSAAAKDVSDDEFEANEKTAKYPQYFASGTPVKYKGRWRDRGVKTEMKRWVRQKEVEKVGFIMDLLEGGELLDTLGLGKKKPDSLPSPKEKLAIAKHYVKSLAKLHELGLVHFDQKPENTFMTADGQPRIADFGYTTKKGELREWCGTPGFIAPELWEEGYLAHTAADVWSMGCVLAEIAGRDKMIVKMGDIQAERKKVKRAKLQKFKNAYLKKKNDPNSLDSIINKCLRMDPKKRPTLEEVMQMLEGIKE